MRIVVAGMGHGYGIGRYEAILLAALDRIAAEEGLDISCCWRRPHVPWLQVPATYAKRRAGETRPPRFALEVLWTAVATRADVVIFTTPSLAPVALGLRALRPSARIVVCTHGLEVWSKHSRLVSRWRWLALLRRVALRRADCVVASATYNVERIVAVQGVRPERIRLIPPVLDPSWHELAVPDTSDDSASQTARLLSVARLDAYKGVDAVIRALPEIRAQVPGVSYTVVGLGTDLERLRRLADERAVADVVHFAGIVSHEDLLREYQRCDVFVLATTGEGFGFVFLEAMAFGKPVVGFAVGGPLDIVVDGETGRLVDPHDDLAGVLVELIVDRDLAQTMGARGRARLDDTFSFGGYAGRWREALRGVLSEPA